MKGGPELATPSGLSRGRESVGIERGLIGFLALSSPFFLVVKSLHNPNASYLLKA